MKTVGVLIGTEDEPVSLKYYRDNKYSLMILKEYGYSMKYIPYDAAIFAEIKKQAGKKIDVIPLFGDDLNLEECNLCDIIFCIYESVYSFMDGGYENYERYMKILKQTSATVYPSPRMQDFIVQKHKYMKYLSKNNYTITPTSYINLDNINIDRIISFIRNIKGEKIAIKPELGSFKKGFKIFTHPTRETIQSYLQQMKKKGFKHLLLQEFIEEFNKFGEIKTYWINNKNIYSYKQQWIKGEGTFSDETTIDPDVLSECLEIGKSLLKDIERDHEKLIHCRIDFACCLNNEKPCRDFFINEIEICPTIGEDESGGEAYKLLAKQVLSRLQN